LTSGPKQRKESNPLRDRKRGEKGNVLEREEAKKEQEQEQEEQEEQKEQEEQEEEEEKVGVRIRN